MIKIFLIEYTFYIRKPFFLPEPQLSYHNARNWAEIFKIFFLTFVLSLYFI